LRKWNIPIPVHPTLIQNSQNSFELVATITDSQTEKGGIIIHKEEVKDLHGEWLLVTRKNK